MLNIRKMTKEDLEEVSIIEKEIFETPWSYESFNSMLEGKFNHYFVLEREKSIIGHFGIQIIVDEAQVHNIGILKEYRNKGYGKEAFKFLIDYCEKNEVSSITLEVREGNVNAIYLYEKHDFIKISTIKNYYTNPVENGFLMKLDLGEKQ